MNSSTLEALIESQGLPLEFKHTIEQWYRPLAEAIASKHFADRTLIVGVQGSQGSGKSTLAHFLKFLLESEFDKRCIEMSLDDFYLRHAERQQLAEEIHPLFQTRGVPGTHDLQLATLTISSLCRQGANDTTPIPRFNKAIDDRADESEWDEAKGTINIILFEGWCVGCDAQDSDELVTAINPLEAQEDPKGIWRNYVNKCLEGPYQNLFELFDCLVVLQAPSFECVHEWRWLQEQKLIAKTESESSSTTSTTRLLDESGVKRFISHYERLTRHALKTLPDKADFILSLDANHKMTSWTKRV